MPDLSGRGLSCELPGCDAPLTTQQYEIRQVRPEQVVTVVLCSWKHVVKFAKRYSMARQEVTHV